MPQEQPQQNALVRLADFILLKKDEIIEQWIDAVLNDREIAASANLTHQQLVNHMPELFDELAFMLRSEQAHFRLRDARTHGYFRWQQGYKLDEVLYEFGLFRIILLEYATDFMRQNSEFTRLVENEARRRIHKFLTNASVASAQQYAEEQENAAQQYQRQLEETNQQLASTISELAIIKERLALATEANNIGIWDWDIASGKITWTENHARLLGISMAEFDGTFDSFAKRIHPEDLKIINEKVDHLLSNGGIYQAEYRVIWPDGSIHWIEGNGKAFCDRESNAIRVLGVIRDITERKHLEQELARRAQEAVATNQAKDEFLALVSHELRNPLTAMLGWVRLLETAKLDEATSKRAVETIIRNIKIQERLVSDLLDIGRVITGKLHLDKQPVELLPIIEASLESVRPMAEEKGIKLEAMHGSSACSVAGDAYRLQQVILNLLNNAIKFTPSGGHITIELFREDKQAVIRVIDSGMGISADFIPYVFDRLAQAAAANIPKTKGLGLGLAIVRHIVEHHGGSVRAESPGLDKGAVFTVTLPIVFEFGE